jgi:hypothetical protein
VNNLGARSRERSYLRGFPLGPIGRQNVDTLAAIRRVDGSQKLVPELMGIVYLEAGPGRSQQVGDERRNDVWDRLGQERDDRYAHYPDLEGHKSDVFTLGIVNPAEA